MNEFNFDELDLEDILLDNDNENKVESKEPVKVEVEVVDTVPAGKSVSDATLDIDMTDIEINTNAEPQEAVIEDDGAPDLSAFMGEVEEKTAKKKPAKKETKEGSEAKEDASYKGPRIVKVYGDELWVENDPKVTNEAIRIRIVEEFGYGEFRKDKTIFDLDPKTGILDIAKSFQKKG